jgi:membrane protease YdiL (CAAX protease family)
MMENEPDSSPVEPDAAAVAPLPESQPTEAPPLAVPATFEAPRLESAPHRHAYPFWSYADIVFFFGLAFPCLLLGYAMVQAFVHVFHLRVHSPALTLVPSQFLGYGFVFFALYLLLKLHYHRPFWRSLQWVHTRPGVPRTVLYGFVLAFGVGLAGWALRTPDINTPMKQLLSDRSSVLLISISAVTVGPICEELAFRGFLQPVLVRSLGPVVGILLAALPFGLLHLSQYGGSWRHVVLVTLAGVGFGWMRHVSGSTRAAAVMHAAYNFIFVSALLSDWRNLPSTW